METKETKLEKNYRILSKLNDQLLEERRYFEALATQYQEMFLEMHDEVTRLKQESPAIKHSVV